MNSEIFKIAGAIALPQVGGLVNDCLTMTEFEEWHQHLTFPAFQPPNWVSVPVWTGLHVGMGYASYLVWRDGGGLSRTARGPLTLYGAMLTLNWVWAPISIRLRKLKWIFLESLVHTGTVAATGFAFFKVNKMAGYLFIPFFAWCSFNSLLNYEIYRRNSGGTASVEEESI